MIRLSPLVLAAILGLGLSFSAEAGPVDTFDIDILTAHRYRLDRAQNFRPCSERDQRASCDYRAEAPLGRF